MSAAEAYDALMLDYAAGALGPARALLVETHLRLHPAATGALAALDAAGGALLEGIVPEQVSALPLPALQSGAAGTTAPTAHPQSGAAGRFQKGARNEDRTVEALALIEAASRHPENLSWRWRAPGLRELKLPFSGASLMWLQGGKALAPHDHTAEEVTLVLRGGFSDKAGHYEVGDIAFADVGFDHSPLVPPGGDCVCLVAMEGKLQFHGLLARITARLLA